MVAIALSNPQFSCTTLICSLIKGDINKYDEDVTSEPRFPSTANN